MVHFLDLLLIFQNGHNVSIVLAILFSTFSVVKVDQHIGQILVQSALNIVSVLLGLGSLLLLLLLRLLLRLRLLLLVLLGLLSRRVLLRLLVLMLG